MAKKKNKDVEKVKNRIVVSIYADEFEAVKDHIGVEELTTKAIREFFGLNSTHRSRVTTEITQEIRKMSREDRIAWLKKIKGESEE